MLIGHTSVHKNKKVMVRFRDGRKVLDRFLDKKSGFIFFKKLGKVRVNEIRTLSFYKGKGDSIE